jgi:uncharacterized protein YqhQ
VKETVELNGLVFIPAVSKESICTVLDLSYNLTVGVIKMVEGPGLILDEMSTKWMCQSQLKTISDFMDSLMDEQIKASLERIANDQG